MARPPDRQLTDGSAVRITPIEPADDPAMARIARDALAEFMTDPAPDAELESLSRSYSGPRSAYFVARRGTELLGGAGIRPLGGGDSAVCELRKMYLHPRARGLGLGRALLEACLDAARQRDFGRCYLETLAHMSRARTLYERNGFERADQPLPTAPASRCNTWYLRAVE